ncbi:MAG: glycosyltransferase family 2 protein [Acidimicrobiales bacterium]
MAVILPCMNEELTIGKVVRDFLASLPGATVYVYDNASTDRTAEAAELAGAVVRSCPRRGKGNVVRRMFSEVEASVYVLADGDDTYDAGAAPRLVRHLCAGSFDMVIGARIESEEAEHAYRLGHRLGNRTLSRSVRWVFGDGPNDMLSGFRVLSRRYVKSFPATSCGFETETEMTVHALDLRLPFDELPTTYRDRPRESTSKLRTLPDGFKILKFILLMCKDYRPLRFFSLIGLLAGLGALFVAVSGAGHLAEVTWGAIGGAALSAGAVLSLWTGVVLDSVGRSRREMTRMLYLAIPGAAWPAALPPSAV